MAAPLNSIKTALLRTPPRFFTPQIQHFSSSSSIMSKYFFLKYNYVPNAVEKRAPHRPEHLKYVEGFVSQGKLILGGAFADPVDSAGVVFKVESAKEVEEFAKNDPYVTKGIVTDWAVREWNIVVGTGLKWDK